MYCTWLDSALLIFSALRYECVVSTLPHEFSIAMVNMFGSVDTWIEFHKRAFPRVLLGSLYGF